MIKFGTDGWRALIARDFTFDNVRVVALAVARYLNDLKKDDKQPVVVIGYDTRFLSKEFATEAALVLASEGIVVHITDSVASTPQVSFHTKQKNADLGVVITASHNPPEYNGFKLKATFGGPATPEQVKGVEEYVEKYYQNTPKLDIKEYNSYVQSNMILEFSAKEEYIELLMNNIDLDAINQAGFKVIFDPMHGAGINTIFDLLPDADEIHGEYNPSFGSVDHPEPIAECLGELADIIKNSDYDIGIATDGDADRLGLFDNNGEFVDSHKIFMILLKYLYEEKNQRGVVAKTVSLTSMVDKYCQKNNIELLETAVGFKHIAKIMSEQTTLIGGEESGGLSTILHIPERDGLFNALLVMEVMAKRDKSLKQLCDELDAEFGAHRFARRDIRVTEELKIQIQNACSANPAKLGRFTVNRIQDTDGFKFFVENGAWLLIRFSGTEPLVRFYAEAENMELVNELLDEGMKLKA